MYNDDEFNDEEQEQNLNQTPKDKALGIYNDNKKMIWILLIVILLFIILSACSKGKGEEEKKSVTPEFTISVVEKTIRPGEDATIFAEVANRDKLDEKLIEPVVWTTSNPDVVTVQDGRIVGVNYGTATITATYTYDKKPYTKTCAVVVGDGDKDTQLTDAKIRSGLAVYMGIGSTYNVVINYEPTNGFVTGRSFQSNNNNVATVDEKGTIKGVSEGTATVTANVNNKFSSTIKVIVKSNLSSSKEVYLPEKVEFNETKYEVTIGNKLTLGYTTTPGGLDPIIFDFQSSDTSIATVSSTGEVEGIKEGTTTVSISSISTNGQVITSRTTVTVKPNVKKVTGITIDSNATISVAPQGTSKIEYTIYPEDATDKTVKFESTDPSIAVVASDGTVSGVKEGSCTIKITANDGSGITTSVSVTVTKSGGTSDPPSGGETISGCGTVKVYSDNNSVNSSFNDAQNDPHQAPANITIDLRNCASAKYCTYKYGTTECTPNKAYTGTFPITDNGMTVLKVQIYNSDGSKRDPLITKYINLTGGTTATYKCYVNANSRGYSDGALVWTNNPSRDQQLIPHVTTKSYCESMVKQNSDGTWTRKLCFKRLSDGKYLWGMSYAVQSTSLYQWASTISYETVCLNKNT